MKRIVLLCIGAIVISACQSRSVNLPGRVPCAEALIQYSERYPAAEPQDLYKLVFQDLYGPGHLITDSASCASFIQRELNDQCTNDSTPFPLYEYTLCDSNFVRVNLYLVKQGIVGLPQLVSALLRSSEGLPVVDSRYVLSHSAAFKAAYDPHYRIVRRDIFEKEFLPLIKSNI